MIGKVKGGDVLPENVPINPPLSAGGAMSAITPAPVRSDAVINRELAEKDGFVCGGEESVGALLTNGYSRGAPNSL